MTAACHVSVMPQEVVHWLRPQECQVLLDGTFGAGGHSVAILQQLPPGGRVIAVDRDPAAVRAGEVLSTAGRPGEPDAAKLDLYCASYHRIESVLREAGVSSVDGVVLDLGLSSDQLADRDRGFSFQADGPLDLRFDPSSGRSAAELLAGSTEQQIADTIYRFGEERFSRRIAKQIVERRKARRAVRTVNELVEICRRCVPRSKNHDIHPATRTFQALRIAVNEELAILETALKRFPDHVRPGGRIVVISFHSLEDRIVKQAFRDDPRLEILTRKPLRPNEAETAGNPRSRSAKLRVAEVVGAGEKNQPPDSGRD